MFPFWGFHHDLLIQLAIWNRVGNINSSRLYYLNEFFQRNSSVRTGPRLYLQVFFTLAYTEKMLCIRLKNRIFYYMLYKR